DDSFVRVRRQPVMALLDQERLSDDEVREGMMAARADRSSPARPSVETLFHAYLLTLPGVDFVGHTHPTPVNALLCSRDAETLIGGRPFPDRIVCSRLPPRWVPHTNPGPPPTPLILAPQAA